MSEADYDSDSTLTSKDEIRMRFHERFQLDLAAGRRRPLSEYLAQFVGYEEVVAIEWTIALKPDLVQQGESESVPDRDRLGPYRLIELLGQGGQGSVYRARDERLERDVAIKLLHPNAAVDGERFERFKREAETAARLPHPGICQVLDAGMERGIAYIAMEYLPGETFKQRIARFRSGDGEVSTWSEPTDPSTHSEPKTEDEALTRALSHFPSRRYVRETVRQFELIARALHFAHESGVLHRDLKPGNLLLTPKGEPKILDFGLARRDDQSDTDLTQPGDFMGTLPYIAPEHLDGRARATRAMDIWALGVSLFEALHLERPFQAPTTDGLCVAIRTKEPPFRQGFGKGLPRDLRVILQKTLEKDPSHRYLTAEDLADDLKSFLARSPIRARPLNPLQRAGRWAARHPALATMIAAFGLALAGTAVWTTLKNRELNGLNRRLEQSLVERQDLLRETRERADPLLLREEALVEADQLWPLGPELGPGVARFEDRHEALFARGAEYAKTAESLRSLGVPLTQDELKERFAPELEELRQLNARIERIKRALQQGPPPVIAESAAWQLREDERRIAVLNEVLAGPQSVKFADEETERRFERLHQLGRDLLFHGSDPQGIRARLQERLRRGQELQQLSRGEASAREAWQAALQRIANNPQYADLKMQPQFGLLPLGPDPVSGLEEFLQLDLQVGSVHAREAAALRDQASGKLRVNADMGLVFVLIPAGSFVMGAQALDSEGRAYDPAALSEEGPPQEIHLSPYWLSKFEMTQGQWERAAELVGGLKTRPSNFPPGWFQPAICEQPSDHRHPVEQITRTEFLKLARCLRLDLPTEAQWEYAATGGGQRIRFAGTDDPKGLPRYANLGGREYGLALKEPIPSPLHEDPYVITSPVGSFEPNAFGLYDATGNVAEMCREFEVAYTEPAEGGEGARQGRAKLRYLVRGGSLKSAVETARNAARSFVGLDDRNWSVGVRPIYRSSDD